MGERLALYDTLVGENSNFQKKGKTTAYTSSNGYMFSFVNKEGEIGIRLSKEDTKIFGKKYEIAPFMSHGSKMRDYDEALNDNWGFVAKLLQKSFEYINSLPTK